MERALFYRTTGEVTLFRGTSPQIRLGAHGSNGNGAAGIVHYGDVACQVGMRLGKGDDRQIMETCVLIQGARRLWPWDRGDHVSIISR